MSMCVQYDTESAGSIERDEQALTPRNSLTEQNLIGEMEHQKCTQVFIDHRLSTTEDENINFSPQKNSKIQGSKSRRSDPTAVLTMDKSGLGSYGGETSIIGTIEDRLKNPPRKGRPHYCMRRAQVAE